MLFNLLQAEPIEGAIADTLAEAMPQAAAAQPVEMHESLFSLFKMGGPLMWVLLALSVVAVYIIGKKWWQIRKASQINSNFMNDIRDYVTQGKYKSAVTLCRKYDNPVARMIETGINRIGRPMSDIQSAVENTGNVEVARLEKSLPILASAMLTTVGGLIVGIIAYFGYNWLTSQISNLVYKMESSTIEFIDIVLNEPEEEEK